MLKIRSILLFFFIFSFSVLLMGNETAVKYFPATIDSFWVYEDQDGNEFTRRAVEGEEIADEVLSAFSYEPELENWIDYSCLFRPSLYKVNGEEITLVVGDEVEKSLNARLKNETDILIETMKSQTPAGAKIDIHIDAQAGEEFLLLPDTVAENEEWDSNETKVVLSMQFSDPDMPAPEVISITFDIVETGKVLGYETIVVPAGTYEECIKVEYRTETTVSVFPDEPNPEDIDPAGETITTVWFAPNVGLVKFHQESKYIFLELLPDSEDFPIPPDPEPLTFELKKYEIKTDNLDSEKSE